ncbi:phosphatidylinositol 4-kinase type II subunit alpha [Myriangium duriaei CBS 260.36]|uniref:Phosphatidylinositol 4-kinase n=1 Tax=Myriangium duriaei CBS 260.36 TaxID=1168546 RepID=A0A9P4J8A7_9PEZI|nr:phosphatidylinositol 4-kinase type II subunit alpha [Myriangium duriaei CBS 260.36]
MPRRPPTSGYARIAQAEEEEEEGQYLDSDEETTLPNALSTSDSQYAPIQSRRRERMQAFGNYTPNSPKSPYQKRRRRTNSGVDIKAINARLEKWAEEIAHKFKIRKVTGKTAEEEHLEIHHSVFQAPDWIRPATDEALSAYPDAPVDDAISKLEFDDIVESVRIAIEQGVHPKLISQGSSGSYFARTPEGKVVGVFKPKDEEPYANKNPKWTKWIHRNLFPFFFGRACLIPNLSYVSEAAAYVLDCRLRTNLVPYTDVVALSSKSFFYDFWERRAFYRNKKPLPEKFGSFQVFLKGYRDATLFLKEHPWPDQAELDRQRGSSAKRKRRAWAQDCRPMSRTNVDLDGEGVEDGPDGREESRRKVYWTEQLQKSFKEELEKLVILDYIMRNTDRGLDNWMIRIDEQKQEANIVIEPPSRTPSQNQLRKDWNDDENVEPYKRHESMTMNGHGSADGGFNTANTKTVRIGAIDNSLSWPWKHPDAWRSFPFGWLFLPVSLIGRPFSEATKQHFLPLLTSKRWWSETQVALRHCFEKDSDFSEKMFARQIAVMKGQAWNVVETLKTPDHGPLELTRRTRVCVWDDIVDIPVATPLRPTSTEIRARYSAETPTKRRSLAQNEEMDISAALESESSNQADLIGLSSAPAEGMPTNPFNFSRQNSYNKPSAIEEDGPLSPSSINGFTFDNTKERAKRPSMPHSRARMSMDDTRRLFDGLGERRRRFSLGISRRNTLSDTPDDIEGDLGYAAAEDQEHNRRKVIVERLETVKSSKPVFTWC